MSYWMRVEGGRPLTSPLFFNAGTGGYNDLYESESRYSVNSVATGTCICYRYTWIDYYHSQYMCDFRCECR